MEHGCMSLRQTAWVVLLMGGVLLATGCSKREEAPRQEPAARLDGPVKIGVVGPLSGDEAHYGSSVLSGVQAAVKRVNAQGGIAGHPVEVLFFDDANKIEQTDVIVKDFIIKKAAAIFAAPTGASTFAPIHLVTDARIPFFSVGTRRHLKGSGAYVFRLAVPDETATEALITHAVQGLGFRRFALVTAADNDYSLDLSASFYRAIIKTGASVEVRADTYDTLTGAHELGAVVAALKRSPAPLQAVVFTGAAGEAVQLAAALKKAGLKLPILGGEDLFVPELLGGGEDMAGTLLYGSFTTESKTPQMQKFLEDYGQQGPDRFAALAYDGVMLLAAAIADAGSTDAAKVREAMLKRRDFQGSTGSTAFSPDNLPLKRPYLFRVESAPSGARFVLQAPNSPASN